MKLKSIFLSSILLNSLFGATYDYTTTPETQIDIPTLSSAISFPSNSFEVSNTMFNTSSSNNNNSNNSNNSNNEIDSDGDGILDSIDSCPNTYGNQSNGCYIANSQSTNISNTITISSNDINQNSDNGVKPEYQINYTTEILKEIIDNVNTKTIQAKEITSSDGKISQAKIEVPKNSTNVTLKATVEVSDNTKKELTTLEAEDKVKITLSNDGGFDSKVANENIEAEVIVNANAEATAKIIVQKKVEVTMKSPKGSQISQENSGRVTSKIKVEADTGELNFKPIEVQMSAETTGNLITTANVTNSNGETLTFKLSLPANVTSGDMELVQNENSSNIYTAIKSNFKTSTNFKVTDKSRRAIIAGNNIEVVGTSAWQKFEEKQYFNGKRTITLVLGSAKVTRDGEEEELQKGVEYELLPPSTTTTTNTELTQIYNSGYLNIREGWNLISNPINKTLNIEDTFKYATATYKYSNSWIQNSKTLAQSEGLWIKYNKHISEKIEGEAYYSDFTNLNSGWNLLGVGKDVSLNELSGFSEIWVYDSKNRAWIKNPSVIYRGYGFWGKI